MSSSISAKDVLLETVCPALGMIIANIMYLAPFSDAKRAIDSGDIGHLNPTPWAVMLGNSCGWVTYGILRHNFYIYFANGPGFVLAVWLNLGASKLLYQRHHINHVRSSFVTFLQQQQHQQSNGTMQTTKALNNHIGNGDESEEMTRVFLLPTTLEATSSSIIQPTTTDDGRDDVGVKETKLLTSSLSSSSAASTAIVDLEVGGDIDVEEHCQRDSRRSVPAEEAVVKTSAQATETDETPNNNPSTTTTAAAAAAAAGAAITTAASAVTDWAKVVWDVTSQTTPAPAPHERLVLFFVVVWTAVISLVAFSSDDTLDEDKKQLIVGTVVNVNLVFFYGAPLSTILTVLRTKTSSSIHIPTMVTNTLNGTFWFIYGLAVLDLFVAVPNGIGALLGVIQIVLCAIFPRRPLGEEAEEGR